MNYIAGKYDIAVIGGGHAGCEAAVAAARLEMKTVIFTLSLDSVASLSCNPNIGGSAKGHLVREIDALGGIMGKVADKTFIQSRMLNKGKGPAVWALRAQSDKWAYMNEMKRLIEFEENLDVRQAEIVDILFDENKNVTGVKTHTGVVFEVSAAIIATGTFLGGKVIVGDYSRKSGPDGMFPATELSENLKAKGIEIYRFKTGTPPRIQSRTIDFTKMEELKGDDLIVPFSFETKHELSNKSSCYLTYTNDRTHKIIRDNLDRAPMYSGVIEGVGPRYCPSVEDKIVRFPEKERHQIFIEPMGLKSDEMYVQGLSTSMPEDVQIQMLHSIVGLENAKIMRAAYAIEYDCINPMQLKLSLEFRDFKGLFGAGQFNGTSGYEEAAAQGLIAGVNAARFLQKKEPVIIGRDRGYIGVLIDDIVTRGTNEPYRMMTSRSEHRLLLRQDNADERLTTLGYEIGLIKEERYNNFCKKMQAVEKEIRRLESTSVAPTERLNEILEKNGCDSISTGIRLSDLIKRPQITYNDLTEIDLKSREIENEIKEQAEIKIKYRGYIKRQNIAVEHFRKLENRRLPMDIDYMSIKGLRLEARQKLNKFKPQNIGQASRVSGVSPADVSVLLLVAERKICDE